MNGKKMIAAIASVAACGAVVFGVIALRNTAARKRLEEKLNGELLPAAPQSADGGRDCIHFLSTGSSDAILLESDGRFAMVDAGEVEHVSGEFVSDLVDSLEKNLPAREEA